MISWASPGAQYLAHRDEIQAAISRVLESGLYILGEEVESFESAFANYCGAGHAVGVGSGTDALILALKALDIGPGDEVVTVSHTALATAAAIIATGATPVLIDVDPNYYTLDPAGLEKAVGPRTRAVIAVHLYGQPADMDAISAIAGHHGLKVIEDCAQATGARYCDQHVGSIGDVSCFSFYPTKNLGAIGDGGMVTTRDGALASRVRRLRQYGWDGTRETESVGVNSRLDSLQAAILNVKLAHLDADNVRRRVIAQRYNDALADLPLALPRERQQTSHAYHLYVIACDDRDGLRTHLSRQQIGSAVHYPTPVHGHRGYVERSRIPDGGLPVTDRLVRQILTLPLHPELSEGDCDSIVAAVRGYYGLSR
jgi:dTDP-4-amino-4,6-dideoxygalactose transaminase